MLWNRIFATKTLEMLDQEAKGENRLRRVLGPIGLTSLGVGAIIGAGIFVMTGRVAAEDAGPAIVVSFVVAGIACALAAFCYAEFASMAPVAGSAYTYAYATLGEIIAWIIGWDLILEYAMSAATVAAVWSKYLNELLRVCFGENYVVPDHWCHDPFSSPGAIMNLPAVLILGAVTTVLVIGIRESAASNTALVILKLSVVLFVIAVGVFYINPANWNSVSPEERRQPEELLIPDLAKERHKDNKEAIKRVQAEAIATFKLERARASGDQARIERVEARFGKVVEKMTEADKKEVAEILKEASKGAPKKAEAVETQKWGMFGQLGLSKHLAAFDDKVRSPYFPFGFSGMMLGAALVFFAFIGFDSISTHAEEAVLPQRDVPIGILASLFMCTLLYVAVAAIISGMEPYPYIDPDAAVASAFRERADQGGGMVLNLSAGLIAAGALAGMTSVLLITFLSQARIFLAMARDGLMPHSIFGAVHEKFRTPHISTMLTGAVMAVVAAFTPIFVLEEMVNIGTLFAFVVVCAAVLMLRIQRPDAPRPFKCPAVYIVAPAGVIVNVILMGFLPAETWGRLVVWLVIGLVIYFLFGYHYSVMRGVESMAAKEPQPATAIAEGQPPQTGFTE
jgi:APA family basic amino acid/polyamine antiporter